MTFEYDLVNNWEIQSFVNNYNDKFIIHQNFGEPGLLFKFKKEINNQNDLTKIILCIESNRHLLIAGNCIVGKKWIDSKEIEINLDIKNINNSFKIFIREPQLFDWFILKKIKLISSSSLFIINNRAAPTSDTSRKEELIIDRAATTSDTSRKEELIINRAATTSDSSRIMKFSNTNEIYKTELKIDREIFNIKGIKQIYISKSLISFSRIKQMYNLKDYENKEESCLFFGVYNLADLEKVINHKGIKYIMYGGTDCDFRFTERTRNFERLKNLDVKYISISKDIYDRLQSKGTQSELIDLDLVDYNLFKKQEINLQNKIYVYLGRDKKINNNDLYGYKEYLEIKERLPEFEFIESNQLNIEHEEMPNIYKQCFIGLRLTKHDGNANTVKEMGAMGIPVVHNGKDKNCLNWNSIDDIELLIKYRWIEKLMAEFSEYKDILFISTDYPNYGGIATNTLKLINFFETAGHNVFGLYHSENAPNMGMYAKNIYITENLKKGINRTKSYFGKDPDLIILRNYTEINLIRTRFTSKVFFMVPGIFIPNVKKNLNEINSKKEFDEITHPKIISCIMRSHRVFTNNNLTMSLLNKYCNINTEIFYFMNVPFYPNKYIVDSNWENRKYYLGVVLSDFTRTIKNIDGIRRILEKNKDKPKILIGKNSNLLNDILNIECIDLLPNDEVINKMKEIKYLVNESFVEKVNNTILEAKYNGCRIYDDNNIDTNILIVSTQYPNYGGGATLAYKLHEYLLKNNIKSYCLFLDKNYKLKNPANLNNVEMIDYTLNIDIDEIKNKIGNPDLIIGFNYVAPYFIKSIYPNTKIAYYLTGSKYISDSGINTYHFINRKEKQLDEIFKEELKTIQNVEYVIPNSYLMENVYSDIYQHYYNKLENIISLEYLFYENIEISEEKIYDLLIVSSRYDRSVKNIELAKSIFESEDLKELKKCCVGKFSEKYIKDKNTTHLGFIDDSNIDKIMQKSKLIIITSRFESMSITLIKAIKNKCLVLTNHNVGGSYLIDNFYIMNDFIKNNWIDKIKVILGNYNYFKQINKNKIKPFNFINNLKELVYRGSIKNNKHILVCSIDTPYIGGSATNAYNVIKEIRKKDYTVSGLFISAKEDKLDPDNIGNIYFSKLDTDIEKNSLDCFNKIIKNNKAIDLIFVKNYKCFCIINYIVKKYYKNKIPIIFSPSGSKYVSDMRDLEKINKIAIDNEFIDNLNNSEIYDLITKYDDNIEKYVMNTAQYILPNSELTFNILNKIYSEINISFPINITYIDYKNNNTNQIREYDVGFICYSWKRKIKGGDIMKNIISNINPELKILIVGQHSNLKSNNRIKVIDNLEHNELLEYMNKTKIICFTSYYDSSPNVLKEAISCGCKILLTENIGNSELIESEYIIKLEDYEIWNEKINKLLITDKQNINKDLVYSDICTQLINYIESCIKFNSEEKESVGIYKVPAEWDTEHLGNFDDYLKETININTINIKNYEFLKEEIFNNLKSDIYFDMFIKESNKRNIKKMNWILVSKDFYKNSKIQLNSFKPFENKDITIWLINNCRDLFYFKNRSFYFVRGNYYNLYDKLIGNNDSILYPATSLIYNSNYELQTQKVINYNFKNLLYDEPENKNLWQQMFPKSNLIHFVKKPISDFVYLNLERQYHIIFVASEKQPTKNHHLFIEMLKYYDNKEYKLNVIYIGNLIEINNLRLKNINLSIKFWVDHNELIKLYNQSKVNILFSGRDALPRVLIESLACGCFNIALDTISDGKYLLTNNLGVLLSFESEKIFDKIKKSVSYQSNQKIYDKIYEYIEKEYNHEEISIKFDKL